MRYDPIEVQPDLLRTTADELTNTAYHLAYGLHGAPGLTVTAPGWSAAAALHEVESAMHTGLTATGARLDQLAAALRSAADGYDAADERASRRLLGTR